MRLFLSYIFLFCSMNCFGQIDTNSILLELDQFLSFRDIKGDLKSVEIKQYFAADTLGKFKNAETNEIESILSYDVNNKIDRITTKCIKFKTSEIIFDTLSILYKKDSTTSVTTYLGRKLLSEDINRKFVLKYDDKGNIVEYHSYNNDSIFEKDFAKYNDQNKLIELKGFDHSGKLIFSSEYRYDENNNQIEYSSRSDYSSFKSKNIYNQNKQLIEQQDYDESSNTIYSYTFRYDPSGNMIETKYSKMGNLIRKNLLFYNSKGVSTGYKSYDNNGRIFSIDTILFHSNGKISEEFLTDYDYFSNKEDKIKIKRYNSDGNLIEFTTTWSKYDDGKPRKIVQSFEYDNNGNWIKSIQYSLGPPSVLPTEYYITERKINYR